MRPRVGYVPGVFDLLHRGHINLLWAARRQCDVLVVGVVSDRGAAAYKGRYPEQAIYNRRRALELLGFVDVVVDQWTTDPTENLERFQPDALYHGDDWDRLREGHETLERLGIAYVAVPYTPGISTTLIRSRGTERERQAAVLS